MSKIKNALLFPVFGLLAACSSTQYTTKETNYLSQSGTVPKIVAPSGTVAPKESPYYQTPNRNVQADSKQGPSLKPPTML